MMPGRRSGSAYLPLHQGRAPRWLYERMVRLAEAALAVMLEEFPPHDVLERFADPFWFQAFGALLGFDWHSSGLTTVTLGAVKEALEPHADWPIHLAGGKGRASRRTPQEILAVGESRGLSDAVAGLVEISRLVAKVDNTALQDGYQLYHHVLLFTDDAHWAVVQQGMPETGPYARRYHWLGERAGDLIETPHEGVVGNAAVGEVLDLTAKESREARGATVSLFNDQTPESMVGALTRVNGGEGGLWLPAGHQIPRARHWDAVLHRLYDHPPEDFRQLLVTEGVGPKTLRALTMTAEVIYGVAASRQDPVRYAYAHGGKDGFPFPVDRQAYDTSIAILRRVLDRAAVDYTEKRKAFRRLASLTEPQKAQEGEANS